ncbi:MAG TPA: hypothetical protein VJ739_19465, partial [Gemmataceae bacterium]|nr:hypothetical protein [Gemmataceae bacterium]
MTAEAGNPSITPPGDAGRQRRAAWAAYLLIGLAAVFVSVPTWSAAVLNSQANDLATHVRHIEEYRLALREGQIIPLVAPTLNGATRIPLFQYYSGTAYVLPGLLACIGINAWVCMRIAIILQSLAAGLAVRRLCRTLGCDRFACLVAAVAFQLFPFGGVDLYNRGGYPEWAALEWLPLLFCLSLSLARPASPLGTAGRILLLAAAWAYYLPIHPLQSLYAGGPVVLLALVHCRVRTGGWAAPGNLVLAYGTGTLLASWFWLPVLLDFHKVQNLAHLAFFDAIFSWGVLLSPVFRSCKQICPGWAPQLGVHFFLAACAAALYRPSLKSVRWLGAVLFLGLLLIALPLRGLPVVQQVFRPLQWNYRPLILGAVLGAVALSWFLTVLKKWLPARGLGVLRGAALVYVAVSGAPYFLPQYVGISGRDQALPVAFVLSPAYHALNSSQYTFYGTDLRTLGWVQDGRLVVNRDCPLPWEGLPFEFDATVRTEGDLAGLRFLLDGEPQCCGVEKRAPGVWSVRGLVVPARGQERVQQRVRFDLPGKAGALAVAEFRVRTVGYREAWFGLPRGVTAAGGGRRKRYWVSVERDRPGLYQLPVNYFPGLHVRANGVAVEQASANGNLLVVPLRGGMNLVEVSVRSHPAALGLMVVAL